MCVWFMLFYFKTKLQKEINHVIFFEKQSKNVRLN